MKRLAVLLALLIPTLAHSDGLKIAGQSLSVQNDEYVFRVELSAPPRFNVLDDYDRQEDALAFEIAPGILNPWQMVYQQATRDLYQSPAGFVLREHYGTQLAIYDFTTSDRIVTVRVPQSMLPDVLTYEVRIARFGGTTDESFGFWSPPIAQSASTRPMTFGKLKAIYR